VGKSLVDDVRGEWQLVRFLNKRGRWLWCGWICLAEATAARTSVKVERRIIVLRGSSCNTQGGFLSSLKNFDVDDGNPILK